jgi:hypothetical protein
LSDRALRAGTPRTMVEGAGATTWRYANVFEGVGAVSLTDDSLDAEAWNDVDQVHVARVGDGDEVSSSDSERVGGDFVSVGGGVMVDVTENDVVADRVVVGGGVIVVVRVAELDQDGDNVREPVRSVVNEPVCEAV